ncbi:MAG: hypothetical protein A2Z11_03345 [Candidatus Woykebacteria bacterium RBG_16_43_9]|uniref:Uncharacterized protein n=1 Tax=Candidatus Woykebacteria bacterium RBG_16_43_9 TaxID=1802596 RepID=A0A1G1WHB1_9BACT|nr:MAG: hypothetical protein A2Z11_03345 [Candidatus Woykebacteria bacterium RBG_16_43_9]
MLGRYIIVFDYISPTVSLARYNFKKIRKKEGTLEPTEFTIAYRAIDGSQVDSSDLHPILRGLNGDKPRERLPRFRGWVVGLPCAIAGETEGELITNARNKIKSLIKIRRSRGLSDSPGCEAEGQATLPGDVRKVKIRV